MMKKLLLSGVLACATLTSGCMSDYMVKSEKTDIRPQAGMATLVVMRPSSFGGAIQSSLFEVSADQSRQDFIGVVSAKTKIAYAVKPGKHLFMIVAENADFMDADFVAGKTYYALVSPRIGVWKARFSLLPIHSDPAAKYSIRSPDFSDWDSSTSYVEKAPTADQWYSENKTDIDEKRVDYLKKWNDRTAEDKSELYLHKQDGI